MGEVEVETKEVWSSGETPKVKVDRDGGEG